MKILESSLKRKENTVGKGEIARYEQFLLFPQCFQKACFPGASKGVIVWEWVKVLCILFPLKAFTETCPKVSRVLRFYEKYYTWSQKRDRNEFVKSIVLCQTALSI